LAALSSNAPSDVNAGKILYDILIPTFYNDLLQNIYAYQNKCFCLYAVILTAAVVTLVVLLLELIILSQENDFNTNSYGNHLYSFSLIAICTF
jgi:hypothetical protein